MIKLTHLGMGQNPQIFLRFLSTFEVITKIHISLQDDERLDWGLIQINFTLPQTKCVTSILPS